MVLALNTWPNYSSEAEIEMLIKFMLKKSIAQIF